MEHFCKEKRLLPLHSVFFKTYPPEHGESPLHYMLKILFPVFLGIPFPH